MVTPSPTADNLVIGGGLAGAMVAIRLATAGRNVTVLEKEISAHHKVCGEFLSREAIDYLRQVGVDPLALGAAPIRFVRLSSKQTAVESALPFTALSLSRFALDQAMLTRAEECGCTVERGMFVDGLTTSDNLWFAQLRDSKPLCARTVFLANGKHDLRGWTRSHGGQNDLVAFKLHWQLNAVIASKIAPVVLVRKETVPDDIHGMEVAKGILTARGGMTSHAAVVCRGMGTPCVAGAESFTVNEHKKEVSVSVNGKVVTLTEGDWISLDGSTGEVFAGKANTIDADPSSGVLKSFRS